MLHRLLVGSHLLILREIPGLASELGVEAFLVIPCRLSHSRPEFLVGSVRLQHVEMAMGIALQLCSNLSDATERLFTAGQEAFE